MTVVYGFISFGIGSAYQLTDFAEASSDRAVYRLFVIGFRLLVACSLIKMQLYSIFNIKH